MRRPTPENGAAPRLRVDTVATLESARFLSDLVQLYLVEGLGLSAENPVTVRVRLALTEIATNVARHAYPPGSPGPLSLRMEREGDVLVSVVGDRAERFNPFEEGNEARLPRPEELKEGGYGLGIVGAVMDEVEHAWSPETGNQLTMRLRL